MGIEKLLEEIDTEAAEHLATMAEGTLMVGITVDGERYVRRYRSEGAELAVLPSDDSVYEIGSVSKVYTSTVLASLLNEGRLSLDDTLASLLPNGERLAPGDDRHPGSEPPALDRRRLGQQHKQRSLQRVVGVVETAVVQLVERPQGDGGVLGVVRRDRGRGEDLVGPAAHCGEQCFAERTTGLRDEHEGDVPNPGWFLTQAWMA